MSGLHSARQGGPFWLRRFSLLAAGVRANRDAPDPAALLALEPAEAFVWGVLPHAARSFAPCIIALPSSMALSAALGYLYCRILDTHEDLVADAGQRHKALEHLTLRLTALREGRDPGEAPSVTHECSDPRDEVHSLIAGELPRLDPLFLGLNEDVQGLIIDLVSDMSRGMIWAAKTFDEQGGVLVSDSQLRRYCEAVLGNPIRFAARLFALTERGIRSLPAELETACMDVGEFLQLANVTRDIEKDLARGVAYDVALDPKRCSDTGDELAGAVRDVRARLLVRALDRAPSYEALVDGLSLKRGWMNASSLLMARFTERYYLGCANRVGLSAGERQSPSRVLLSCWPALLSSSWASKELAEITRNLKQLRAEVLNQTSSMKAS